MRTESSKLTSKYQATIPEAVRKAIHLRAGDTVVFDIDGEKVSLRKATPVDMAFAAALEGTLDEWSGEADEDAYREL
ncbi:MAG: AbrB/MazE/SpoVT family DNA-binding domain-containing protein [Gammaproteobacteria bacterium]|nr:AbrB/MazE/SpoVT family DNA-binding domain-containing protein [Gammaproteobacteria bacterium]